MADDVTTIPGKILAGKSGKYEYLTLALGNWIGAADDI